MSELWTYKVDKINTVAVSIEKALAERGNEGYELVTAYREGPFLYAIFKRKEPDA